MSENREVIYVGLIILLVCVIGAITIVGTAKIEMLESQNTYLNNELHNKRWENSSERLFPL